MINDLLEAFVHHSYLINHRETSLEPYYKTISIYANKILSHAMVEKKDISQKD